ncbi:aminomethyl transferase family protein [Spongisporangium articulatum]|uniref:Aminomethyl transferase family protein n=1 Tax=Spongisporangium articulatum TaxID=3362603 RepID=A0ABW8AJS3_9ACTN
MVSPLKDQFPDTTEYATIGAAEVATTFGDLEAEYAAIRENVAKFDLSGAGLLEITGADAYDLLQMALARDLEFVTPEQSLSSLLLDADGKAIDVVVAYYAEEGFRLETSTGTGPATAAHLTALKDEQGLDAEVSVINDRLTIILVEGPQGAATLEETIEPDLGALPLSGLMEVEFAGADLLVSRSGFTGEYGYKIFVSVDDVAAVWNGLEIQAAGQTALEAAMFEIRQPVIHIEDTSASALANGYAWLIDITKEEFFGRDAVLEAFEAGGRADVVGYATSAPQEVGTPVSIGGTEVGTVVNSLYSPGRKDYVGLVRLREDLVAPHLNLTAAGGAQLTTLAAPYVLPVSWNRR